MAIVGRAIVSANRTLKLRRKKDGAELGYVWSEDGTTAAGDSTVDQRWLLYSIKPEDFFPRTQCEIVAATGTWGSCTSRAAFIAQAQAEGLLSPTRFKPDKQYVRVNGQALGTGIADPFVEPAFPGSGGSGGAQGDVGTAYLRQGNTIVGHVFTREENDTQKVEHWALYSSFATMDGTQTGTLGILFDDGPDFRRAIFDLTSARTGASFWCLSCRYYFDLDVPAASEW